MLRCTQSKYAVSISLLGMHHSHKVKSGRNMFVRYSSIFVIALAVSAPASAKSYNVTVLQDVGGLGDSDAYGINARGQIVGYSYDKVGTSGLAAVLWSSAGTGTALQDVGGAGVSEAFGINDRGQIVGTSDTASGGVVIGTEAVLWSPSGKATVLQDVGGLGDSGASGINARGQIFGYSYDKVGTSGLAAVLWSSAGTGTALQDVGGAGVSEAFGINDRGQIVGTSETAACDPMCHSVAVLVVRGLARRCTTSAVRGSARPKGSTTPAISLDIQNRPAALLRSCSRRQGRRRCFRTWAARVLVSLSPSTPPDGASEVQKPWAAARTRCYGRRQGRRRTSAPCWGLRGPIHLPTG